MSRRCEGCIYEGSGDYCEGCLNEEARNGSSPIGLLLMLFGLMCLIVGIIQLCFHFIPGDPKDQARRQALYRSHAVMSKVYKENSRKQQELSEMNRLRYKKAMALIKKDPKKYHVVIINGKPYWYVRAKGAN